MIDSPLMEPQEIEKIIAHLSPKHTMLEWGSGGSTLFFPPKVARYYSIEHDPTWYHSVAQEIAKRGLKNVHISLVKPNAPLTHPTKYNEVKDYIEFPKKLGIPRFDRVLIDGRGRPECAKALLPLIDGNSIVFFHDFYLPGREYYRKALDHYVEIDSVKSGPRTLTILRKK
jgi:predicted O-methyltransferase YrrM